MKFRRLRIVFIAFGMMTWIIGGVSFIQANTPLDPKDVPDPLKLWVPWVLEKHEGWDCPMVYNDAKQRVCAWPSQVHLVVTAKGGSFSQEWEVMRETDITLPGERAFWPQQVSRDQHPLVVRSDRGRPTVRLPKGHHTVRGTWRWSRVPESLLLPKETALLDVTMNGKTVAFPQVGPKGRLWFRSKVAASSAAEATDTLEVRVFRKLIDEIPFQLVTQIQIVVGGQPREILLPDVLEAGMQPLSLESPVPAQIDTKGQLRLQARAGEWGVTLITYSLGPVNEVAMQTRPAPWPEEEIWVVETRPALRIVEIVGVPSVDPQQTLLPTDWRRFPAYRMSTETVMTLTEQRRGHEQSGMDRLQLTREWWLDFDGEGYTVRDELQGTLEQAWRLGVQPPMRLGRVELNGQPHVVTHLPGQEEEGIEVRRGAMTMMAESRIPSRETSLPAVGWETDIHAMSAMLHVPPGWRLLHASGVDRASQTWMTRWTLLDMFLVLIAAVVVARLWSWPWGIVAGLTLALIYHEPEAPVWIWAHVLAAAAFLRVLPTGRWQMMVQTYRIVSLVILVAIAVPFVVQQVRVGLYPQLEYPWKQGMAEQNRTMTQPAVMEAIESDEESEVREEKMQDSRPKRRLSKDGLSLIDSLESSYSQSYAPDMAVQTGPGLPSWGWNRVQLEWSGPVSREQQFSLWYLSPTMTFLFLLLQVCGVGVLIWRIVDYRQIRNLTTGGSGNKPSSAALPAGLAMVLSIGGLLAPAGTHAEMPSKELLTELETRLLTPPSCLPACADIPQLHLTATTETLRLRLAVHTQESVVVPLPGPAREWRPQKIFIDGEPAIGVTQEKQGHLWLFLQPGVHQVIMEGVVPDQSSFVLALPLTPHHIKTTVQGWTIQGIGEEGVPEKQLHLRQEKKTVRSTVTSSTTWQPMSIPPLVRITRMIQVGLDWRMQTVVERMSPKGSALALSIPLLPGEVVKQAQLTVKNKHVQVQMDPHSVRREWSSQLPPTDALNLIASQNKAWIETYRFDISPLWHPTFEGIPAIHPQSAAAGAIPEWRPWPGETFTVHLIQPLGVEGVTLTVEASHLTWKPGQRATDGTLIASFRSSQGRQHAITVPEGAQVESVKLNGSSQPIHQEAQLVTFPVQPGQDTIEVAWRTPQGIQTWFTTPTVDLGVESVNAQVTLSIPSNRWVVWVNGPRLGPAVLLWGILVVMIGIAGILGRLSFTPLRTWHWVLLGLGLTQIPIMEALVVVGWFGAVAWRRTVNPKLWTPLSFNMAQIGLALLTLMAAMCLVWAIQTGLVGQPDMGIVGNGSTAWQLQWFQDRTEAELPQGTMVSLPLWVYRVGMLLWALWLALAVVTWVRWGWTGWTTGGYWQPLGKRKIVTPTSEPSTMKSK